MSTAGGIHNAFLHAAHVGGTTMQVFTKNASRWRGKKITDEDIQNYKSAEAKSSVAPVVAHAAYLINLCATDKAILQRSRDALRDELQRCELFGITGLIFHPGAHLGAGEDEGLDRIADSINIVHEYTPALHVRTTLETTAGQGTALGYRFEQLRRIIDRVEAQDRLYVCIDTCHLFAAGYDIRTEHGWVETMREFESIIGFDRLLAVHVNDSVRECGSRIDRHASLGKGHIGYQGFRCLMTDDRFATIPKILETPKRDLYKEDIENLGVLRSLADGVIPE
jgi:deoxyribonuclease IV